MTDLMHLLRAADPVRDCPAPDFDRLLERLEREPDDPRATRGVFLSPRAKNLPRMTGGRRALAMLVPSAVAIAVAAVAILSLHSSPSNRSGPPRTAPSAGSLADSPGQAQGRVLVGSMHRFTVTASGAHNTTWGAEWFRTSAGQICVQAGREVGRQLGYVDIDGIVPHDGSFHAWAPDTAVNARCIAQPAHGGIALTVVERVADSGLPLSATGACTATLRTPCPAAEVTTLYYGLVGSSAVYVGYGSQGHGRAEMLPADVSGDGGYVQTGTSHALSNECTGTTTHCPTTTPPPGRLVHPGARAFVLYSGSSRTCTLTGPGVGGVMSGRCLYGLTLGPSPDRLSEAQVRATVRVTTKTTHRDVQVTARFRTRVASSRIAGYSLRLSTPDTGCLGGQAGSGEAVDLGTGAGFSAGRLITVTGSVARCTGTYHGSVVVQPLVGGQLTVARFSFTEHRRH